MHGKRGNDDDGVTTIYRRRQLQTRMSYGDSRFHHPRFGCRALASQCACTNILLHIFDVTTMTSRQNRRKQPRAFTIFSFGNHHRWVGDIRYLIFLRGSRAYSLLFCVWLFRGGLGATCSPGFVHVPPCVMMGMQFGGKNTMI